MRFIGMVTFAGAALSCTSGLAQIAPDTSATVYRELTCPQLLQEGRAISQRGFVASGLPAGSGGTDATNTAPAVVNVWPETTAADKQQSEKISLALSEMNALEQASIASQCSIRFQRPPS
jgi:hypothetical protein